MASDKDRFCSDDEQWVCACCGKHVENDRYLFDDESCMLNAIKVKKADCFYKDDDVNQRVVEVLRHEDD